MTLQIMRTVRHTNPAFATAAALPSTRHHGGASTLHGLAARRSLAHGQPLTKRTQKPVRGLVPSTSSSTSTSRRRPRGSQTCRSTSTTTTSTTTTTTALFIWSNDFDDDGDEGDETTDGGQSSHHAEDGIDDLDANGTDDMGAADTPWQHNTWSSSRSRASSSSPLDEGDESDSNSSDDSVDDGDPDASWPFAAAGYPSSSTSSGAHAAHARGAGGGTTGNDHNGNGNGGNAERNDVFTRLQGVTSGPDDTERMRQQASDAAVDAFRRVVTGIVGTLPADLFDVVITCDRAAVSRLLQSALLTGYALRNAEVRMVLNDSMASSLSTGGAQSQGRGGGGVGGIGGASARGGGGRDFAAQQQQQRQQEQHMPEWMGNVDASETTGVVRWWDMSYDSTREMPARDYVAKLQAENDLLRERLAANMVHEANDNKLIDFMKTLTPDKIDALQTSLSVQASEAFRRAVRGVLGHMSSQHVQTTHSMRRDYLAQLALWGLYVGYTVRNIEKRLEMTRIFQEAEAFAGPSVRDL